LIPMLCCWKVGFARVITVHALLIRFMAPIVQLSFRPQKMSVALTKTAKKTRDHKANYVQMVREAIDRNDRIYVFSYENMRSNHFKDVRLEFRGNSSSGKTASMNDSDDEDNNDSGEGRLFLGKK